MESIWEKFVTQFFNVSWQEWVSTFTQILSVIYAKKNNILVYPTGIIGVLLAAWMYMFVANPPLYAESILNVYYFGMSVLGWYNWSRKDNGNIDVFKVSKLTQSGRNLGIIYFLIGWSILYLLLTNMTDSDTPVMDSFVSAAAVTAMYWMALRKIENWIAWIISNLVAIPLNFYKGFFLFSVMYVVFLVLAIQGYYEWKKMIKISEKA